MKRISMFYFSGTGNTKYAIETLSANMSELGWESKAIYIEQITTEETQRIIDSSDVVIIGYPIYCSDMPDIMRDFLNDLKPVGTKQLGIICTQLMFSGDGSSFEKKRLERLGFKMIWGYQLNMFNCMTIKGSPFRHSKGYEENQRKLVKINKKLKTIAQTIDQGNKRIGDNTVLHHLLGLSQRPAYRHMSHSSSQYFSCREDKCVKCQKCVRNCPKNAIEFSDGKISFAHPDRCIGCLRCYNFCPMDAIQYKGTTKTPLYKGPTKEIYKELFK